eukprot:757247-Hanusia_phi.AAC.3
MPTSPMFTLQGPERAPYAVGRQVEGREPKRPTSFFQHAGTLPMPLPSPILVLLSYRASEVARQQNHTTTSMHILADSAATESYAPDLADLLTPLPLLLGLCVPPLACQPLPDSELQHRTRPAAALRPGRRCAAESGTELDWVTRLTRPPRLRL